MSVAFDWQPWLEEGENLLWSRPFSPTRMVMISILATALIGVVYWYSGSDASPKGNFVHGLSAVVLAFLGGFVVFFGALGLTGKVKVQYGLSDRRLMEFRKNPWNPGKIKSCVLAETRFRDFRGAIQVLREGSSFFEPWVFLSKRERTILAGKLRELGASVE